VALVVREYGHRFARVSASPATDPKVAGHVVRYLSPYEAVVSSRAGRRLAFSSTPLLAPNARHRLVPVNLGLRSVAGGFAPVNPSAPVLIGARLADGVAVGGGLRVAMAGVNAHGRQVGGSTVMFPSVATDSDAEVEPTANGAELQATLRSPASPETLRYSLTLPTHASLAHGAGGAVVVLSAGRRVAEILPPVATDAQGSPVPASMRATPTGLVVDVRHRETDFAYPILVDPQIVSRFTNGQGSWSHYGPILAINSNNGAYTFADPLDFVASADHPYYGSPYDWAGWHWVGPQLPSPASFNWSVYDLNMRNDDTTYTLYYVNLLVGYQCGSATEERNVAQANLTNTSVQAATFQFSDQSSCSSGVLAPALDTEIVNAGGTPNGPALISMSSFLVEAAYSCASSCPLAGGPITTSEGLGPFNGSEATNQCQWGSHPVNCANGNFWHQFTDTSVPARGLPLTLTRTYNSLDATTLGPFGYGWSSSYAMHLSFDSSGDVTVHQEDGATVTFQPDGAGGLMGAPRVIATLVHNPDGSYTFTRRARTSFAFSEAGLLLSIRDLNGDTNTLGYNGSGQLSTITDAEGRQLSFAYGPNGDVSTVTDPAGRTVSYSYDTAGNLTSGVDVAGGTTTFSYDRGHLLTTMTDPRNGTVTNQYNGAAQVLSQTDPMHRTTSFAYAGATTTITDPRGNVTTETYSDGELASVTKGSGTSGAATSSYVNDPNTAEVAQATDANGDVTSYSYDSSGNLLQKTDPLGRITSYTYNRLDEPTSITLPMGETTTIAYDANGNETSVSRPVGTTGQTQTTSYAYQDATHPSDRTSMTDPDGNTWTYSYDRYGDLASVKDPAGAQTTYSHSCSGTAAQGCFANVGLDYTMISPRGNAAGADAAQFTTTYTYDPFGDLTQATDPLGHTTHYEYDGNRSRTEATDANNNATTYVYNADNELTQINRPDNTTVSYTYDGDGNRVSWTDGAGKSTTYGYDPLDRLISVSDPLTRQTTYAPDGNGNVTTITDPSGATTTRKYDADNELTSVSYSDGSTAGVTYAYNADGMRTAMTDGTGASSYSYDTLDRLTSTTNGNGQTLGYSYDLADNPTTIVYPNGKTITQNFDSTERLHAVTDWLGHQSTFGYTPDSAIASTTYPAVTNNVDTYGYDSADQLTSIHMTQGATTLASLNYTRDPAGQVLSDAQTGLPGPASTTYQYNALQQLSSAAGKSYRYDGADAMTTQADASPYTYDAAGELTSSPSATYTYTELGQRASSTAGANGRPTTYSYDQPGRLTSTVQTYPGQWLAGGENHSLARADGKAYAWGDNTFGQLGNSTVTGSKVPVAITGLGGVSAVAAGAEHSLALETDGTVWAWGANTQGQLGNGTTTNASTPIQVHGLTNATAIAAGATSLHSLALQADGTVRAWGDNHFGQLGNNTTTNATTPVQVSNLTGIQAIAAGGLHSLALTSTGTVYAWGAGLQGQLGDNSVTQENTPIQVSNLTGVIAIAAGDQHSLALKSNGTVWAWGANTLGQLGNGATGNSGLPVQVTGLTNIIAIAAGKDQSLALKRDGTVWAWGNDTFGQLGNNTTTARQATPVQIANTPSIAAIAAGAEHTLLATTTGTVLATGDNVKGQLGNNTTTNAQTPIPTSNLQHIDGTLTNTDTYDGDGLRATSTTTTTVQHYAWNPTGQLPLLLTDGQTNYIYGPDAQPLEQIAADDTTTYLHHDLLGSTRLITSSTGTAAAIFTYGPYGTPTQSTGTTTTTLGYSGQYTDPQTGLQYLQARYYDPTTGQFLSRDPLQEITGQPYSYANDNPINGTDPTGLDCGITDPGGCINDTVAGGVSLGASALNTVGQGLAAAAPVAAPILDAGAGVGCVAFTAACPAILGVNTGVQEVLVGAQAAYTPGYSASDALAAQGSIATGYALGALGAGAAEYSDLGTLGKALLGTAVGSPQILLDGVLVGNADAATLDCSP
jgi:RHS repeat-associated protein